jgi:catechol 2,3-dioxygenase-like lactoylglutathione lyase family enzyme
MPPEAPPIGIRHIDHLVLRVRDLDAMVAWYGRVLGCPVERRQDEIGLVLGRAGGAPPGAEGRNLDHFCFRVEPFDEGVIRAHLAACGVDPGPTESRYGAEGEGPSIYLQDPEGNTIELKGPPA